MTRWPEARFESARHRVSTPATRTGVFVCVAGRVLEPGTHLIGAGGDANRISVQTAPGTTAYIETSIDAIHNWQVNVEQKPEAEAKKKIAKLSFRAPANKPAIDASTTQP